MKDLKAYKLPTTGAAEMYIKYLLENGYSFGTHCTTNGVFVAPQRNAPDPSVVHVSFTEEV